MENVNNGFFLAQWAWLGLESKPGNESFRVIVVSNS